MFDRFTDGAKHAMNHARQEARAAGHDTFSTGHILLGLTYDSSGAASRILASAGVRAQDVRPALWRVAKEAGTGVVALLPFSRRAKTSLENTLVHAQALVATVLGSEHLLLGLLEDEENDACCALREVKVEPGDVRDAALRWVQGDGDDGSQRSGA
jgi:ATP-dependent Clp protease ATP-binding subunit ClpC